MKKVALITVTYNAEKNLSFFLPSLIKNREILSGIFFVDNNSKDKTLKELENFKENQKENFDIEIILNEENYGYSYALNMGIRKALDSGYDYFCITNNDLIFEEGFFA
ncbi:MAG: glycosyltransferase, partial [Candidatus Nomurabacteria bacterium]|nr:glycosyltransferase [Candidatus Nomurabacteria bacterium]